MPEEEIMRNEVVQRMTDLILSIWPAAKVEVFGSFRTNLYLPTSDIDLAVFGKWETLPLYTIEKGLISEDIAEPASIKVLDKATVPIIKLTDKVSKIRVDISFNTESSVKSAEMVKTYIKEYKILPYLFLVLKHFLVQRDLNEVFTGGISSYCLLLMTVSFLQRHPRVDLQNDQDKVNLGVLLMEFFELYGRNFNYQRIGIKIKNGGRYISKDELLKDGEYPALLCIEDPVTLACDIGRSSYGILRVKEAFEYAFNVVDSALRNKNYFLINPNSTYLSRIISVPKDLIEYREWVKKEFDSSKLKTPVTLSPVPPTHLYQVTVPQYQANGRPALLPTPPSPFSPRMSVITPPYSPYASNSVSTYRPVAFFNNNNIPNQQIILQNVTNANLIQSTEVNVHRNIYVQTNPQNVTPTLQMQPMNYVLSASFNPPPVEQVVQPPTTPVFSPVKTTANGNTYVRRNYSANNFRDNFDKTTSMNKSSRNSLPKVHSPKRVSPRSSPKNHSHFDDSNVETISKDNVNSNIAMNSQRKNQQSNVFLQQASLNNNVAMNSDIVEVASQSDPENSETIKLSNRSKDVSRWRDTEKKSSQSIIHIDSSDESIVSIGVRSNEFQSNVVNLVSSDESDRD